MRGLASRKRRPADRKLAGKVAIGLALFGIACFVKVWQRVSIDQMNRVNWQLWLERQELKRENALLIVHVEELLRSDRITGIAAERLGLVPAKKITLILNNTYENR